MQCQLCGKSYKTQYGLDNHSRLHCPHEDSWNMRLKARLKSNEFKHQSEKLYRMTVGLKGYTDDYDPKTR